MTLLSAYKPEGGFWSCATIAVFLLLAKPLTPILGRALELTLCLMALLAAGGLVATREATRSDVFWTSVVSLGLCALPFLLPCALAPETTTHRSLAAFLVLAIGLVLPVQLGVLLRRLCRSLR